MLLEIHDGTVSRNGQIVLSHFEFGIKGREKIAIVGRNGAGKTTLVEVLAGIRELDADEKHPEAGMKTARKFTTAMLTQTAVQDPDQTVEECIWEDMEASGTKVDRYSRESCGYEQRFDRIFTELGFSLTDKQKALGDFSGGEQTKIMLIRLLLSEPDVLILDEPTNHLDLTACEWLEDHLKTYPKAVVVVSHDRYFIDRTAEVVWEVTGGKLNRFPGNYSQYRREKADRYQKQLKAYEAQQAEIARLEDLIEKFKHKPRKAAFARSRKKILERMERIQKPDPDDAVIHAGEILPDKRGGKVVLECEHLKIGYQKPIRDISFRLRRGQKVGIFGANGTGKTAFLKTIAGKIQPLAGKVRIGDQIEIGYFDQMTAAISSPKPVFDWFHDQFPHLKGEEVRSALAGFLFKGPDLGKSVQNLSGGEKARLVLASILWQKPNFLILDEPTNNMDIPAKETLESIFRDYKGTVLFVSHDRYFLSRVADALLFFEPEEGAPVLYYPFGYDHYEERKKKASNGADPAAVRTAEEQRLIEGLKQVPKGTNLWGRELPNDAAYFSWQFDLNREPREQAEAAFRVAWERAEEFPKSEAEWDHWAELSKKRQAELKQAGETWTDLLLKWYEIWCQTPEGR